MSKLADNLQRDENIIMEGKIHWVVLVAPACASCVLIGIPSLISRLISMFTTELSLSNKRIVGKYGLINTQQMDSPLNKINSISISSGLFGKMFGYGNIVINTTATTYVFKNISQPEAFKHNVLDQMDKFEQARIQQQAQALAGAINNNK